MYFNASQQSKPIMDARRAADIGWDPGSLEPNIKKSTNKLWSDVPPMIASFDLETTGLNDPEPISFGLAIFRNGNLSEPESQHFLIDPRKSVELGAFETHGWTDLALSQHRYGIKPDTTEQTWPTVQTIRLQDLGKHKDEYNEWASKRDKKKMFDTRFEVGAPYIRNGQPFVDIKHKQIAPAITQEDIDLPPAVPLGIGISKIVRTMSNLQKQGFIFVGANPTYDTECIKNTWERENSGSPVQITGWNPGSMRLVDVIKHDESIQPKELDPRSRSLSSLAAHYGIEAGGHRALHDSIAAGRVFIEGQIPFVKSIIDSSATQRTSFKLSGVEASALGIDYTMGGPCFGPVCGFCNHLNEVALSHEDPAKSGKVKEIMKVHQGM